MWPTPGSGTWYESTSACSRRASSIRLRRVSVRSVSAADCRAANMVSWGWLKTIVNVARRYTHLRQASRDLTHFGSSGLGAVSGVDEDTSVANSHEEARQRQTAMAVRMGSTAT